MWVLRITFIPMLASLIFTPMLVYGYTLVSDGDITLLGVMTTFLVVFAQVLNGTNIISNTVSWRMARKNKKAVKKWIAAGNIHPEELAKSIFRASSGESEGTAFCLKSGAIVSNRHVLEKDSPVRLLTKDNRSKMCAADYLACKETGPDLAFSDGRFIASDDAIPGLRLASEPPKVGDVLMSLGMHGDSKGFYPSVLTLESINRQDANRFKPSRISAFYFKWMMPRDDETVVEASAPFKGTALTGRYYLKGDIVGGCSGSPLVNAKGEVVGVIYAGNRYELLASDRYGISTSLDALKTELGKFEEQLAQEDASSAQLAA